MVKKKKTHAGVGPTIGTCKVCGLVHPPTNHDQLDHRLRLFDPYLCAYIRDQAKVGTRDFGEQILHMLKFAAAQMSPHDNDPIPVKGEK
jgi:hypothetical protein